MGSLVPFDTGRELLSEEAGLFDKFFNKGFEGLKPFARLLANRLKFPAIEIKDSKENIMVKAELPGIEKKDLKVDIKGNLLTIQGQTSRENEVKKNDYHYIERMCGSFYRGIPLSASVVRNKTRASYNDGILKIELQKDTKEKSKDGEIVIE
ncbi:MAG: Hsp20/alpha crystallin family protein [bacterium]